MQGVFLMIIGILWPRLRLTPALARIGFVLAVYGVWRMDSESVRAILGAGNSMLRSRPDRLTASAIQEGIIAIALRSAAVSLIAAVLLMLWGFGVLLATSRRSKGA